VNLKFMGLLSVLLLGAAPVVLAQNGAFAPYVDAGIGFVSSTATSTVGGQGNPTYTVGAGIESSTKPFLLDVNGQYTGTNLTGSGYVGQINASGYLKLGGLLVGGGGYWSQLSVNSFNIPAGDTTKQVLNGVLHAAHPVVGGGYQFKHDRFLVNYVLPVGANALPNERVFNLHNEIFLANAHFRITQDLTFNSYDLSDVTSYSQLRTLATSGGVGLKLVF
jgi:hypothetical protein